MALSAVAPLSPTVSPFDHEKLEQDHSMWSRWKKFSNWRVREDGKDSSREPIPENGLPRPGMVRRLSKMVPSLPRPSERRNKFDPQPPYASERRAMSVDRPRLGQDHVSPLSAESIFPRLSAPEIH